MEHGPIGSGLSVVVGGAVVCVCMSVELCLSMCQQRGTSEYEGGWMSADNRAQYTLCTREGARCVQGHDDMYT